MTKEEVDARRKQAEGEKRNYIHRGQDRTLTPADACGSTRKSRRRSASRFRRITPLVIDDQICGQVEVQTNLIGDPVIARSDGSALYNFATVVDDIGLKITHVIRAKEHLSNTPVQVLIYEALGVPPPVFAHVPVVNAPNSNKKLSKRDAHKFVTPDVIATLRAVHAVPSDGPTSRSRKTRA